MCIRDRYEAGILIDAIGPSVKSTSRDAYEKIKSWISNTNRGTGSSKYLSKPVQGGVLNIGAGTRPIENAYNIDINPTVEGVYQGSATNLSGIATGRDVYKRQPL